MSVNYGSDTYCLTDVPLVDLQVSDPFILIGQRIVRRLTTPRGGLGFVGDDANGGWDVRQYVLARVSPAILAQAQSQVQAECLKDEEVQSAIVTFTYQNGGTLLIKVQLVASQGPFTLVLNVSQLTVSAVFSP